MPDQGQGSRRKYALFFGCSFVFGDGVNDNETLPYYFSQLNNDYHTYNYAFHGYGPQHMLVELQQRDFSREIHEQEGILIYEFQPFHVERAIGTMHGLLGDGTFPRFVLDASNRLVTAGSFRETRPWRTSLYQLFASSRILRKLGIGLPPVTTADIRLTARIIQESAKTFRAKFHSDQFYVLIYPQSWIDYAPTLMESLREMGIKYID